MRESEAIYRSLVENTTDAILGLDLDGRIISWNKGAEAMLGYSPDEILGEYNYVLVPAEYVEECKKALKDVIVNECVREAESARRAKDGRTVQVDVSVAAIYDDGDQTGFVTVFRDVSKRKRIEAALEEYTAELEEANHLKDLFIDIMHHDLHSPLSTIYGTVELLREGEDKPEKRDCLDIIERSVHRGLDLIDSATKFSKLETLRSLDGGDMDLRDALVAVMENLAEEASAAGVEVENRISGPMPIRGSEMIQETFVNLLSNAIKYGGAGTVILQAEDEGATWKVSVADFGEGIKDKYKESIFQRFHRARKEGVRGSGLGLAIARRVVELHGGEIWVEDNPEGGSVFKVRLPKA